VSLGAGDRRGGSALLGDPRGFGADGNSGLSKEASTT
jgi:hypothetical protein